MQQLLSIQNGDNADLTNVNHFQTFVTTTNYSYKNVKTIQCNTKQLSLES